MKRALVVGAALTLSLGGAALALAADDDYGYGPPPTTTAPSTETTTTPAAASAPALSYRATLGTRAEVPRPNAPARAAGVFTAKVTERQGRMTIRWTLTFRRLSGAAVAAHIHRGRPGVAGPVVVALCGPCRNGQNGRRVVDDEVADRLRSGFYVNVHTAKNPAGEIRGQLRRVGS
jgi:hypothetical protein